MSASQGNTPTIATYRTTSLKNKATRCIRIKPSIFRDIIREHIADGSTGEEKIIKIRILIKIEKLKFQNSSRKILTLR